MICIFPIHIGFGSDTKTIMTRIQFWVGHVYLNRFLASWIGFLLADIGLWVQFTSSSIGCMLNNSWSFDNQDVALLYYDCSTSDHPGKSGVDCTELSWVWKKEGLIWTRKLIRWRFHSKNQVCTRCMVLNRCGGDTGFSTTNTPTRTTITG